VSLQINFGLFGGNRVIYNEFGTMFRNYTQKALRICVDDVALPIFAVVLAYLLFERKNFISTCFILHLEFLAAENKL